MKCIMLCDLEQGGSPRVFRCRGEGGSVFMSGMAANGCKAGCDFVPDTLCANLCWLLMIGLPTRPPHCWQDTWADKHNPALMNSTIKHCSRLEQV